MGKQFRYCHLYKNKLKETFSGDWCCIVGTDYSSSVIYCEKNYINVKIDEVVVLMFQSGKYILFMLINIIMYFILCVDTRT